MTSCQRPDMSERLMMALSPQEFPQEMAELEEHLKDCASCRHELAVLRQLETVIKKQNEQLGEAVRPCPDPEILFDFATGENVQQSVRNHIGLCAGCAEQISMIRELRLEHLDSSLVSVPSRARRLVHAAFQKEYGQARQPILQAIIELASKAAQLLHVPSLAIGAVAASLLLLLVVPHKPEGLVFRPALSGVSWQESSAAFKGMEPEPSPMTRLKVALIILLPSDLKLPAAEVDGIYANIAVPSTLGTFYYFLSPAEIKDALKEERLAQNGAAVAKIVARKAGTHYVLTFEILPSKKGYTLKGRLFSGLAGKERLSMSQTGLMLSAIPARISRMSAELLYEEEASRTEG
jgi:hypothetical protein